MTLKTALLAALAVASVARGQVVSHLNLVSDKSENLATLQDWKAAYIKDGMSDQDKAIAIFNSMTRYRHQANPPREGYSNPYQAGGHVHDPLKTIHVYGYGQCCCVSAQVTGLARYIGMTARGRDITAHSVAEIHYDDAWHLIDCSVMNYHLKPDGSIASVDEIHQAVAEWIKDKPELLNDKGVPDDKKLRAFAKNGGWKKGPALLARSDAFYGEHGVNTAGWHGWPSTIQEYFAVRGPQEFSPTMGYQLNVQLRPGEKITRNFFSRGIDYTNAMAKDYYKELQTRKSLGLQTRLGDRAPGRVGDGTIEWNVPMDQLKTVALSADESSFVLRFPSSYVYVKGKADIQTTGPVTVHFSDTNGLTWKELAKIDSTEHAIDLTPLIKRRYDFRLKFDTAGGGKVEGIRSTLDFQCSQAALPVITEGPNTLTFSAGPQEGTITLEGGTDAEHANKQGQLSLLDFQPHITGMKPNFQVGPSGAGEAVFDIATPGEMKRLRISTVWRARDAGDGFDISTSTDGGQTWTLAPNGQLEGKTTGSSRYLIVNNLPAGTRSAKVKVAGRQKNTAVLWDLRIDADYAEPHAAFKPVKITYTWDETGQTKTFEHIAKTPRETFDLSCGQGAVPKSFTMQLAD